MSPNEKTPRGYARETRGNRTVLYRDGLRESLEQLGFLDGEPRGEPVRVLEGRVPHSVFPLPHHDARVIWKRCRRGGLLEPLLGDRHRGVERFLQELETTRRARERELPVAEILALAHSPAGAGFRRVELLTVEVAGARDLMDALLDSTLPAELWREIVRETARVLRRFHDAGFLHGDLNLKNILWRRRDGGVAVTLIDLDAGALRHPAPGRSPAGNVFRLQRSYHKGELAGRWSMSRTDFYRFLDRYTGGDRKAIRDLWRRGRKRRVLNAFRRGHAPTSRLRRTPEPQP